MQKDLDEYDEREMIQGGITLNPMTAAHYRLEMDKLEEENAKLMDELSDLDYQYKREVKKLKDELAAHGNLLNNQK